MAIYRHENGQEIEVLDENHVSLLERNGFVLVEEKKAAKKPTKDE